MKPLADKPISRSIRRKENPSTLVIGYGNELRGDDAAGPEVARAIEERQLPGVDVLIRPQLTPELADNVAQAETVIFVDAGAGTKDIRVREVTAASNANIIAHSNTPEAILSLAVAVFQRTPKAWLITIPARQFAFRQSLSETTRRAVVKAVDQIIRMLPLPHAELPQFQS